MSSSPFFVRLALRAILLVLVARPTFADEHNEAKSHYVKGTKAYEIGAYDEAIKEYGEAYRLVDDPALLYNLGQAHRLAGHSVEALRAYRMFLLKVPNAPNRPEVEDRIAELQTQAQPTRPPSSSSPESTTSAPQSTAPPMSLEPPPAQSASANAIATPAAGKKKLIAGGVVAGVGVLSVVGGIVCGVLAQNAGNSITHAAQMGQMFDYNTYHAGQTEQAAAIALLAVGGAAVIAGTTVMIVGRRQSPRAHAWVQPLVGAGTAGLAFVGTF